VTKDDFQFDFPRLAMLSPRPESGASIDLPSGFSEVYDCEVVFTVDMARNVDLRRLDKIRATITFRTPDGNSPLLEGLYPANSIGTVNNTVLIERSSRDTNGEGSADAKAGVQQDIGAGVNHDIHASVAQSYMAYLKAKWALHTQEERDIYGPELTASVVAGTHDSQSAAYWEFSRTNGSILVGEKAVRMLLLWPTAAHLSSAAMTIDVFTDGNPSPVTEVSHDIPLEVSALQRSNEQEINTARPNPSTDVPSRLGFGWHMWLFIIVALLLAFTFATYCGYQLNESVRSASKTETK
jgi:hypothetical protein